MRVCPLLLIACCAFLCSNAHATENLTLPGPYSENVHAPEDPDDEEYNILPVTDPLPDSTPERMVDPLPVNDSSPERMVEFYKNLFGELGRHHGDIAEALTPEVRDQYAQLEANARYPLGTTLTAIIELRILDLELSLSHTHRLLEAVQQLAKN
jgi:hypothetical protein